MAGDQATEQLGEPRLRIVEDGAAAGWEPVYREHVVPVYRFVYARVGNRPDAEDVTAQTFLRCLPRLRLGASSGEVRAYLLAAARSALAEHWALHYGAPVPLDEERDEMVAEERPAGDGGVERATALLARLPDGYRRVLELRFLRGFSVRETAHELGISVANAKVTQWRALRRAAQLGDEAPA